MYVNKKTRELLNYSTLDLANNHLKSCSVTSSLALFLPVPLVVSAVYGFFYFQPTWYTDPFLWAILALFALGQFGALIQLIILLLGTRKAGKALAIVNTEGDTPDLGHLQERMIHEAPSCHIRDSVLRWIQLGIQGETKGIERMMEHAAARRDQTASKIMSFHTLVNRTTLKLGFLGTLIGLMMTFEPMKQAMLSLQGSEGEFKFINDIVKAIDGDAYAILTTLFATGISVFIELLTLSLFDRILGQFEMVNNNLDDWCIIHLQPWISKSYTKKKDFDAVVQFQQAFAEKIMQVQKSMDEQLKTLAGHIQETGRQMMNLLPLEKELARKLTLLAEYENQYRKVLNLKMQSLAPENLLKGARDE